MTRTLHDVDFSLPFSTCYELKNCEVGAFFRGLSRKAEFKNLSGTSTSQVASKELCL